MNIQTEKPQENQTIGNARPLLWVAFVIGLAVNVTIQVLNLPLYLSIAGGVLAAGSGVALILSYYRRRNR